MKRALTSAIAVLSALFVPVSVGADPGHERPKITVMKWKEPPVTASSGDCEDPDACEEEVLIVKAHDPDSSITEVQVKFDEEGERGPIVFAHTYCLQGKQAGEPARLEIPVTYSEPGHYVVAAVAYSHKRCLPHERGDAHPVRHSRIKRLATTVEPAP